MKRLLPVFLIAASLYADAKIATGRNYQSWPQSMRAAFAGYLAGYATGRSSRDVSACLSTMSFEQAQAILDKYVADHPDVWQKAFFQLAAEAFLQVCEKNTAHLPDDAKTDTLLNGRGWSFLNTVSWGSETKVYYVRGLAEAFALSGQEPTPCSEYRVVKIEDTVQEFERLYQDAANLRIPMAHLFPTVVSRVNGSCVDEQFQKVVEALRRWAAAAGTGNSVTK